MSMCNCWLCAKLNDLMTLRIRAQKAEKEAESRPFPPKVVGLYSLDGTVTTAKAA
jgi:hypothetical protein